MPTPRSIERLMFAMTFALVLFAVGTSWSTVRRIRQERARVPTSENAFVPHWKDWLADGSILSGTRDSATILEFTDYRCHACRVLDQRLRAAAKDQGVTLNIVVRQHPVAKGSAIMARAALCSSKFGFFPTFHSILQRDSVPLTVAELARLAAGDGTVTEAGFAECVEGEYSRARLTQDSVAAHSLGVVLSPTFIVDGHLYVGVPWDLEAIVARSVDNINGVSGGISR